MNKGKKPGDGKKIKPAAVVTMLSALFILFSVASCASAEKVAPENASVGYFTSLHDCAVANSGECGKLNMAAEYIFNESNSQCTWWCRPVRGQNTSLAATTSLPATSSSTTQAAASTTLGAQTASSPDYTVLLIVAACVIVLIWQIIAYLRSLKT